MKRFLSITGSIIIIVLGVVIMYMIISRSYFKIINPGFMWLGLSASVLLLFMGAGSFFIRLNVTISGIIAIVLLIAACLLVPVVRAHGETSGLQVKNFDSSRYVPINLAELFMQLFNDDNQSKINTVIKNGRFVFRGFVYKNSSLNKAGDVVVARTVMVCCFADMIALGFIMKAGDLSSYRPGQWVKVYGHIERAKLHDLDKTVDIQEVPNTDIADNMVFVADKTEPEHDPDPSYITRWNAKEPYNY